MAPENIAVPAVLNIKVATKPAEWEIRLARNTAAVLAEIMPGASENALTRELLRTLRKEHAARLRQNLDHWPEYAPAYLARQAEERLAVERKRQDEAVLFMDARRGEALAFAKTFFASWKDAEDAVAEAESHLWEGKTSPKFFFRKLRQLIVNKLKRRKKEQELFRIEESFDGPKIRSTRDLWECVNTLKVRPEREDEGAVGLDDPLTDLLYREAVEEGIRTVDSDRKRASVKHRQWWKDLIKHRPGAAQLLRK